ncbi:MAG: hypothetical protein K6T75_09205 [Acetobacteraceae bacterium]|nr:hypothetical protein [Acetobacteraceae bacterium]
MFEVGVQAADTANRLLELAAADRQRIRQITRSGRVRDLYSLLLERPVMGLADVQRELGVAYNTAASLVGILEGCGILKEITGRGRGRRWVYQRYTEIWPRGRRWQVRWRRSQSLCRGGAHGHGGSGPQALPANRGRAPLGVPHRGGRGAGHL